MSVWFNADPGPDYAGSACGFPQPWAVLSPNHGDVQFTACDTEACTTQSTWRGYSAYKTGLQSPSIVTSNTMTASQFLGR